MLPLVALARPLSLPLPGLVAPLPLPCRAVSRPFQWALVLVPLPLPRRCLLPRRCRAFVASVAFAGYIRLTRYLVTALVPSLTACLRKSPESERTMRTAVCTSRDDNVAILL
jgi:hypothetical protein